MKTDPQIVAQAAEFVKCFKQKGRVHVPAMLFRLWPQFMHLVRKFMEEDEK